MQKHEVRFITTVLHACTWLSAHVLYYFITGINSIVILVVYAADSSFHVTERKRERESATWVQGRHIEYDFPYSSTYISLKYQALGASKGLLTVK